MAQREKPRGKDQEERSATAELIAVSSALEQARSEARNATVAAHAAEKRSRRALAREQVRTAEAIRLAKKWRQKYRSLKRDYERAVSSPVWKIVSRLSEMVNRARTMLSRESQPLHSAKGRDPDLQNTSIPGTPSNSDGMKQRSFEQQAASKASSKHYCLPDLEPLRSRPPKGRIAAVLHLYYPELWPEFRDALYTIPEPADLFVTLTVGHSDGAAEWIHQDFPGAQILTLDNLGRDIFPFVTLVNAGVLFKYDLVCKLHTKRSMHKPDGDAWRRDLLQGVLGNAGHVANVLNAFDADPDLGIVVAEGSIRKEAKNWSKHAGRVNELCLRAGLTPVTDQAGWPAFPAGSIYWIRSCLLQPVIDLNLTAADFEPEPLPPDSCTPHAIERLIGHFCREAGMSLRTSTMVKDTRTTA